MADFLDKLAKDALDTINDGYYNVSQTIRYSTASLKATILGCRNAPVIAEIKFVSPSMGRLRENQKLRKIAQSMEKGGAIGISILSEPKHFHGRLEFVREAQAHVSLPVLMKDIVLSHEQVDAACAYGASVILLILAFFDRGYCRTGLHEMINYAHSKSLEILLEVHTAEEFKKAMGTDADLIGINNRDLKALAVDLRTTKRILERNETEGRIIVSESGINTAEDIRFLRKFGAHAFLVGSAIMKSTDIKAKVMELVNAY
jgi:indole-3-glycerol phosphate synthase